MNKKIYTLSVVIGLLFSIQSFSQTQLDLNQDAHNKYVKADKELNAVYSKILKEYKQDTAFTKNFKKAQKLWLKLRDAEMEAMYPEREANYYGSILPMCWDNYMTQLTEERTKKIRIWLTGIKEGDACSGSVKIN